MRGGKTLDNWVSTLHSVVRNNRVSMDLEGKKVVITYDRALKKFRFDMKEYANIPFDTHQFNVVDDVNPNNTTIKTVINNTISISCSMVIAETHVPERFIAKVFSLFKVMEYEKREARIDKHDDYEATALDVMEKVLPQIRDFKQKFV